MRQVTAAEARAAIAHVVLGVAEASGDLGAIRLHSHQVDAAERVRALLREGGGALLADAVGLGKTYSALSVAQDYTTLVIAPSALRYAWREAAARAAVAFRFASVEELSRGRLPDDSFDLVIIDEAHHLRVASTNRFAAARSLCRSAKVLLLTATPIQNSEDDLRVLLSLFLGEVAHALPAPALARYLVRTTAEDITAAGALQLPNVESPAWLEPIQDADCLDRLLALPPPVPLRDGGDAGALAAYSLVRQWSSSRAALDAALRRRLARGLSLIDALRAGRYPARDELASWVFAGGAQQLAFPELLIAPDAGADCASLLRQVELHVHALRDLLGWLSVTSDPDVQRASRLRALLRRHPDERIVAFSEYAETVSALFTRLAPHERAAMLTHTGGRTIGGPLTRRDVIDRFAPGGASRFPTAERIDLLLATDVLSEGVGLHDASIVVHVDLAWNPARLEQRVGRLRRLGARRDLVRVFLLPPPVAADRLLRMEQRLETKLARAARTVGIAGEIVPGPAHARQQPFAGREHRIAGILRSWRSAGAPADPVIAGVRADRPGALVCVRGGDGHLLLACERSHVTDARDAVERVLDAAGGAPCAVPDGSEGEIVALVEQWLGRHRLGVVVDLPALRVATSRRTLLQRVAGIARRTPRHARPGVATLVQAVRAAAAATLSAGAERVLDELSRAPMADDAWLQAVGQFAELHARGKASPRRIAVILLLVPEE